MARHEGAATYEFTVRGDTATLRLGGKDGALGSVTTSALVDGTREMRSAEVCAGKMPAAFVDDRRSGPGRATGAHRRRGSYDDVGAG